MALFKLKGVHVPHHKNTANLESVNIDTPKEVLIPMNMHIGAPASPIVSVGDKVYVGQKIAEASGYISACVHSSVSGTVKKIDEMLASNGSMVPAILIESDGLMENHPDIKPIELTDKESFVNAVKESGMVGLGGAGFPTYVKFNVKDLSQVEEIIINCAECEPYITADTRTMIDDIDLIKDGVKLLEKYLEAKKIVFGIESNKPEAIKSLKQLQVEDEKVQVSVLPAAYPQGGEKVLIFNTVKKIVPEGKLPLDVGVIIINVTTLAKIALYINTGMPLVSKTVTVDGSCVNKPMNVIVPIGTRMKDVFAFCGGFKEKPAKVIYGGPMMGMAVPSIELPVIKSTNAIVALNAKEAKLPEATDCIKCGRCINHCPFSLDPVAFAKVKQLNDPVELIKLKVNLCMECGVCAYVCPAKRPIVQNNRLAKQMVRDYLNAQKAKEGDK